MMDTNQLLILKEKIFSLKEELSLKREKIKEIEKLIDKEIDVKYRINFWELTENELDKEMGTRLSILNEDIDCIPSGEIKSHRKIIGVFIIFLKKIIRKLTLPYLRFIFERQKNFNEEIVAYQLASFIRFRQIEEKLNNLKQNIEELKEKQETIIEAINSLLKKNERE